MAVYDRGKLNDKGGLDDPRYSNRDHGIPWLQGVDS